MVAVSLAVAAIPEGLAAVVTIVLSIGVGVGSFLVIGVIRISLKQDLRVMFLAFYALAFALM